MSKNLKLKKVIKSFVPEQISDSYMFMNILCLWTFVNVFGIGMNMSISHIRIMGMLQSEELKNEPKDNAQHQRDDIGILYVSWRKGGKDSPDSVDTSIQRLENYIKKSKERLNSVVSNSSGNI